MKHFNITKKTLLSLISLVSILLFVPESAYAADGMASLNFGAIIPKIQYIINICLALAIIIAAWRMIYLALVCGLIGIDPLGMATNNGGVPSRADIHTKLKLAAQGFFKGLLWISSIFVIFNIVLTVASMLSSVFTTAFG